MQVYRRSWARLRWQKDASVDSQVPVVQVCAQPSLGLKRTTSPPPPAQEVQRLMDMQANHRHKDKCKDL